MRSVSLRVSRLAVLFSAAGCLMPLWAQPDLAITKTHSGNFLPGGFGSYRIRIENVGTAATSGEITFTDTLPTGLTVDDVLISRDWTCNRGATVVVTCSNSSFFAAGGFEVIEIVVQVAMDAPATVTNTATVSNASDTNPANNTATDPTNIVQPASFKLSIAKSHTGNFTAGQTGATYTIVVTNSGGVNKLDGFFVTVTDTLPSGLTATAATGTGWTCGVGPPCTRTDALAAGASYPPITLTVDIAVTAPSSVVNTASVSGGTTGGLTSEDSASDPTTILRADLSIAKSHSGNFIGGQSGSYSIVVRNAAGTGPTFGQVTVSDPLPSGLTATAASGTGWTCGVGPPVSCTRSDVLAAGASYPAIAVAVNVANNAAASVTNTATVSGGGDATPANNSASDPTTILTATLQVSPSPLSFTAQALSGQSLPSQNLIITISNGSFIENVTATVTTVNGGNWLQVSPTTVNAPAQFIVQVEPSGLAAGEYNGTIAVSSPNAANSPVNVPVRLTVTPAPTLLVSPSQRNFAFQVTRAKPANQTLTISSSSAETLRVTAAVTTGNNFLQVTGSGNNTPATLTVSVDPTGLTPGTYNGTITVTSARAGNSPLTVPVTLTVTAAPMLTASPPSLNFEFQISGALPASQTVAIDTTNGPLPVTAAVTSVNNWLQAGTVANTPATLTVTADPTGLSPGMYNGTITVTSPGIDPLVMTASLLVTGAPALRAVPREMSFAFHQSGPLPAAQPLSISATPGSLPVTIAVTSGNNFLQVSATSGNTPITPVVSVDPAGLTPGIYNGTITITGPGAANSPLVVPVTLSISPAPVLTATPPSLSFAFRLLGPAPAEQHFTVKSSAEAVPVTATVSTGYPWLQVEGNSSDTPSVFGVSVNPFGLAPGQYDGTITVASANPAVSPLVIHVSLTVSPSPMMVPTPAALSFAFQLGGQAPPNQTLHIDSSGDDLPVGASASSGGNWLQVTGGGTTPTSLTVSVNPAGLTPGPYHGAITVTSPEAGNLPLIVPVTLIVSPAPVLEPSSTALSFAFHLAGPLPDSQTLTIRSSGDPLPVTATVSVGDTWLQVSGSGDTPAVLTVSINPAGLTPGLYDGRITVSSPTAGNNPLVIPVGLLISPGPVMRAAPTALSFAFQLGGTGPAPQTVTIESSADILEIAAEIGTPDTWLQVQGGGNTPTALIVTVTPAALGPGTYTSAIEVTSDDAPNSPLLVPVTLVVSAAPVLRVAPAALSFETLGPAPAMRTIDVTSSGAVLPVSAQVTSGNTWLQVSGSGETPSQLTVTVNPAGLTPGLYNGTITVTSAGAANNPVTVPVSLMVGAAGLLADKPSLLFAFQVSGSIPPSQTVTISSSNGPLPVTATVTSGNNFLQVAGGGNTPAALTVTVNPTGLTPGTYNGTITVTSGVNGPLTIPVTLLVTAAPTLIVSPTALSFAFQVGGAALANQTLTIRSSGPAVPITAAVTAGSNFLQVSGDDHTPAGIVVSVNPTGLAPGTHNGTITVTSAGAANSPLTVPVTLVVSAAPVMQATPHTLLFDFQIGSLHPGPQTVTIGSSAGALPVVAAVTAGGDWLHVSGGGNTPAVLTLSVNATSLAPGTYNGAVTVTGAGAGNSPLTVPVTLVVTPPLAPQSLIVSSSDATLQIAATASTSTGGNWLQVAGGGDTPAVLTASLNPAGLSGLSPGTYDGAIRVTAAEPSVSPLDVPVTLVVFPSGAIQMSLAAHAVTAQGAGMLLASPPTLSFSAPEPDPGILPALEAAPAAITFAFSTSGPAPASQHFTVTAGDAVLPVSATAATVTGGDWLQVSGDNDTPASYTVSVNPAGLSPGTYNGAITITSADASNSPLTVPVSLVVSASPVLQAAPPALNFSTNGPAPGAQTVNIAVTGAVPLTVAASASSGASWLSVSGGGATPAVLTVSVNPVGLAPDTYNGAITVTAAGAGAPLVIPVHLTVGGVETATLAADRPRLSFTFEVGGPTPEHQLVTVMSDDRLPIELAVATREGGNWLAVTGSGETPVSLDVAVRPAGLAPGTYTGTITVTAEGSLSHLQIPVALTVIEARIASPLTAAPASLLFTSTLGGAPPPARGLQLFSNPPGLNLAIAVSSDAPWLSAPVTAVAPETIPVTVNPVGLAPGSYTGTLTVTSNGATSVTVPVTLMVLAADLTVRPAALAFVFQRGGPVPPPQTLTAEPSGFAVESTGPWLSVSGLTASVDPTGLLPGTYHGSMVFSPSGIVVPVTLTVQDEPTLSVSPRLVVFRHQPGDPAPAPQTVAVASAPTGLPFTAQPDQPWISVNPASGSAPAQLAISLDPSGLAPGSYSGAVRISANASVAVALHIVAARTLEAAPSVVASVSATTFREQVLAPGMIFTLFGSNMGPQDGVAFSVDPFGFAPHTLAGTEVLVNGIPVPLLYVQSGQINAIAPFALTGETTANIQVRARGLLSDPLAVAVQNASPGIFTVAQNGTGQGAILNEDGSFNNADNPTAKGSVVALFGDGAGALAPAEADGLVTGRTNLPRVALPVSVLIGGQDAEVIFAGAAPGFVAGVTQINVRIPVGVPSGQVPVVLRIGEFASQANVTVAVR